MDCYINPDIAKTNRVFPLQGRRDFYRYDMNENPEGLPKEFIAEVLSEVTPEFLSMYPEPNKFINAYADFIGVSTENLVATNGSDMAIRYLLETFGERGKSVVTVSPSFEMYRVNCSILGLVHVPVEYEADLTINIEKIIAAINKDTRIVVLLNPNNPIGDVYTKEDLERIVCQAKKVGAIIIIDEAYHYFYPETFLQYSLLHRNIVVLRTFSKLFSLAACRLGVVIGSPEIIHYIKNAKLTFDVNSFALLFGEKILGHRELIEELVQTERAGRKYTLEHLRKRGYYCRDCNGNFILVEPKHNALEVAKKLEEKKYWFTHTKTIF